MNQLLPIKGFIQIYDWGKLGKSSLVAQLSNEEIINEDQPYAGILIKN